MTTTVNIQDVISFSQAAGASIATAAASNIPGGTIALNAIQSYLTQNPPSLVDQSGAYSGFLRNVLQTFINAPPIMPLWVCYFDDIGLSNAIQEAILIDKNGSTGHNIQGQGDSNIASGNFYLSSTAGRGLALMFCQGVQTPEDSINVSRDSYANPSGGFLPGLLSGSRSVNEVIISFLENNGSFVDTVLRPWMINNTYKGITYSLKKNINIELYTKTLPASDGGTLQLRKHFILRNAFPIRIDSESLKYADMNDARQITFAFESYDILQGSQNWSHVLPPDTGVSAGESQSLLDSLFGGIVNEVVSTIGQEMSRVVFDAAVSLRFNDRSPGSSLDTPTSTQIEAIARRRNVPSNDWSNPLNPNLDFVPAPRDTTLTDIDTLTRINTTSIPTTPIPQLDTLNSTIVQNTSQQIVSKEDVPSRIDINNLINRRSEVVSPVEDSLQFIRDNNFKIINIDQLAGSDSIDSSARGESLLNKSPAQEDTVNLRELPNKFAIKSNNSQDFPSDAGLNLQILSPPPPDTVDFPPITDPNIKIPLDDVVSAAEIAAISTSLNNVIPQQEDYSIPLRDREQVIVNDQADRVVDNTQLAIDSKIPLEQDSISSEVNTSYKPVVTNPEDKTTIDSPLSIDVKPPGKDDRITSSTTLDIKNVNPQNGDFISNTNPMVTSKIKIKATAKVDTVNQDIPNIQIKTVPSQDVIRQGEVQKIQNANVKKISDQDVNLSSLSASYGSKKRIIDRDTPRELAYYKAKPIVITNKQDKPNIFDIPVTIRPASKQDNIKVLQPG